jgi:hypothetical protein
VHRTVLSTSGFVIRKSNLEMCYNLGFIVSTAYNCYAFSLIVFDTTVIGVSEHQNLVFCNVDLLRIIDIDNIIYVFMVILILIGALCVGI